MKGSQGYPGNTWKYKLLVNASFSDDFSLGPHEKKIPIYVDDQLLRFNTNLGVDREKLKEHFALYDNIESENGRPRNAVGDFYVQEFFSKVEQEGDFDSVDFYMGDPARPIVIRDYRYEFSDGGRTITVYHDLSGDTETKISRLAIVSRGNLNHAIICRPRTDVYPDKKQIRIRVHVIKNLLGENHNVSYMYAYPIDVFQSDFKSSEWPRHFLTHNENNMVLVFSSTGEEFESLGEEILSTL